jgi:hypothetical protein
LIAHVVLFQPRRDLPAAARDRFAAAFERALTSIPQVRRARVGERKTLGRAYDRMNERDFPYAAIIEFDEESDLRAYLDHPAHDDLAKWFYETAEAALVYDFELREGANATAVFRA